MTPIVVDCHSHVFNAEDIPIDGFLKRTLQAPSLLTGVFSGPLDLLAAGLAPGAEEAARLLVLIGRRLDGVPGDDGLESAEGDHAPEILSDAQLDARLVQYLSVERAVPTDGPPPESGLESIGDPEDAIAALLAKASPEQLAEIDEWLGEAPQPEGGLEGPIDAIRERALALRKRAAALREMARRYRDALGLIAQPRHRVVARLALTYPEVQLFVPTLVDFDRTARDRPSTPVHEQISLHSLVAKLSVVGGIPGRADVRVHPFVAFCPYREVEASELARWDASQGQANPYVPYADPRARDPRDLFSPALRFDPARARPLRVPTGPWASATLDLAGITRSLDLVRHAVELGGFMGVKLYPPSGFLPIGNVFRFGERRGAPLDAALRALYRYCEDSGVPILTHASHSNGFDKGYDDLAAPSGWEQVLREYGGLHLCFGHFGHLYGAAEKDQTPGPNSWPMRYLDLIDRHDHVYADVGCSRYAFDTKYRSRFDRFLLDVLGHDDSDDPVHGKRRRRLMFGSDYWMNTLDGDHTQTLSEFSAGIQAQFGDAALAQFRGGNALRWLGLTRERPRQDDEIDTASRSYQRLVAFYGAQPSPTWLQPR